MSPKQTSKTQKLSCKNSNLDELKSELQQLKNENQVLKQIMDDMVEGVCITDEHENIIWINRTAEEGDGLVRAEVIGRPEAEVYKNIGRFNRVTTITGKAIAQRHAQYYLPDGRRVDALLRTIPYFFNNQLKAVATIGFGFNHLKVISRWLFDLEFAVSSKVKIRSNRTKYVFKDIIGSSKDIKDALKMAQKVAFTNANVLIFGETGTGKELFAQSIHNASRQADGQFVAINCSAIPETLLESILFGTSKGAFTGAVESPGLFELADGGSLFLDEINSMPMKLQAKILRVLQEREVQRLGEKKVRSFDCRIISATNVDPLDAVKNNVLRKDIYFRLATVTVVVPPLRERQDDIPLLISFFLNRLQPYTLLKSKDISPEVMEVFNNYHWPGNIRELEHSLEYAAMMLEADDKRIEITHLPLSLQTISKRATPSGSDNGQSTSAVIFPLVETLNRLEYGFIQKALAANNEMITKAADSLGLSRQALYYRIKRLRSIGFPIGQGGLSDL
jgi:arginine utilization regulatory protein